jgi:predicted glycosyltransferase
MQPLQIWQKTILVAPLNWGLGHATRCIPIINQLLLQQNKVLLAGDGPSLALLSAELPHLTTINLPAYNIRYAANKKWLWWVLIKQLPKVLVAIYKEHKQLQKLIAQHKVDVVVSDNRYGLFSSLCTTIFITHQIFIMVPPWLSKPIHYLHQKWIGLFNYCWIPDNEGPSNLSGMLSHQSLSNNNYVFIGPLSRFNYKATTSQIDLLILLSGPEPQRTIIENILINILPALAGYSVVFIRGSNSAFNTKNIASHVTIKNIVLAAELELLLNTANKIIARSGYSTLMDLHQIKKGALLIPTPGQTEQEYLAQHACISSAFSTVAQHKLTKEIILQYLQM